MRILSIQDPHVLLLFLRFKVKVGFAHNPMCGARIQKSGFRIRGLDEGTITDPND